MILQIKQAEPCHLPEIARLEQIIFPDPWSVALLEGRIHDPACRFLVVEGEGVVQGYGILQLFPPEAEVLNIAVNPTARRQGVGRCLLGALLEAAGTEDIGDIHLEVRVSNTPAQGLYRGFGFREIGLRNNYYDNPSEDAVVMIRGGEEGKISY